MQETCTKGVQDKGDWMGKGIQWELCKRLKFDHIDKWYMHKPEYFLREGNAWNSLGFWEINGLPNPC